jgi:hypothetical protein
MTSITVKQKREEKKVEETIGVQFSKVRKWQRENGSGNNLI